jgi:hypothetical protein
VPAILVVTEPFLPLALYEAERRGMPDPRVVVIEHPLGGTDPDEIIRRAGAARSKVLDLVGLGQRP